MCGSEDRCDAFCDRQASYLPDDIGTRVCLEMRRTERSLSVRQCPRRATRPAHEPAQGGQLGNLGVQDDFATGIPNHRNKVALMPDARGFDDDPLRREVACRMEVSELPMSLSKPDVSRNQRRTERCRLRKREDLGGHRRSHTFRFHPTIYVKRRCNQGSPSAPMFWRRRSRQPYLLVVAMVEVRYNTRIHGAPAMSILKLTAIGNSVGVILPKELLAKLGVGKGDTLHAIETEDGIRLTTADPDFEAQMAVARRIMRERRNVLRELAK